MRFQRAEEEGNAFAIMLYDLPANSDLVGEPVSRLLEYDNMTLALWGITKSNFKECLFADVTLRINGMDALRVTQQSKIPVENLRIGVPLSGIKLP